MTDRALTLGDWFDLAKAKARDGASVAEIVAATGISESQARLFWNREHPASDQHTNGLRKTLREPEAWLRNCTKELARKVEDE